jgi:CRISPR/Cas system-associated exonuclease Cas4 (RecB family)
MRWVQAHELSEYVYCKRSLFLARQGVRVSERQAHRQQAGTAFHELRGYEASQSVRVGRWAIVAAIIAVVVIAMMAAGK